jgi:glycosyltransferase involved in cell wall biosynthesis
MRNVMGSTDGASSLDRPVPPRVLHVIPTALGRGAQVFARALVDELGGPEVGHRLVSLFDGPDEIAVDGTLGLAGVGTGLHPVAVASLVGRLRRFDHDVLVAHGGDAFKYLALSGRGPIVYLATGTWPTDARRTAQRLAWTALARRAWMSAAVSDDVAADCRAVLSLRRDRVTVIPNGRDDRAFVPAARTTERPVTLLFVGHWNEGKRPRLFVQLLDTLRRQGHAVAGRMVGEGPLQSELAPAAAEVGIEMTGWCRNVVPHFQGADILVFPSAPDGEGMPGVLVEAGLCGLPAISTRVAGASTVIDDGRTGVLVDVDDLDGMVRAATALIVDAPRRRAMGEAARRHCAERFALSVVAARWDGLLRAAAARGPRRDPSRERG